jgi:hypothetical protein
MEKPLFHSPEQAITVLWHVVMRASPMLGWLAIAVGHSLALWVLAAALWWHQVTPGQAQAALQGFATSTHGAMLGVVGLSGLTLLAGYGWLMKRLHRALMDWAVSKALPDAGPL